MTSNLISAYFEPSIIRDGDKYNILDSNLNNNGGNQVVGNNNKVHINYTVDNDRDKCPISLPYRNSFWGPTKNYHGREDELKRIHSMLEDSSTSVLSQAITGLGGVGKTECAKRYAEIYGDHYKIIIFVVAEVLDFLAKEMYEIAEYFQIKIKTDIGSKKELLPIRKVMNELYSSFSRWGVKTLLVFDNTENPKLFAAEYLPMRPKELKGNLKILITSRWQEWNVGDFGIIETFHLDVFSNKEAYEYVKISLINDAYFTDKDINRLIEVVQCFPLALHQAVAYILEENDKLKCSSKKFTLAEYLKLYSSKKEKILASGQSDMYKLTVRTTWKVSMKKLKEHRKYGRRAIKILKIIAFLAPDKIPFKKIFKLDHIDNNAINLLRKLSLINVDGDFLNIHRLVQDVVKLDIKNVEKCVKKTIQILSNGDQIYFQQKIDDHLYEVLKTAVEHENIYRHIYNQFVKSPLELVTVRKDCEIDVIKKMSKYDVERKNNISLNKSFENSVINRNFVNAEFLYDLLKREFVINNDGILKYLFSNHGGNEELIIYILEDINMKFYEYNPLDLIIREYEQFDFKKIWPFINKFKWNENLPDLYGNTIFMRICKAGYANMVREYLKTDKCKLDQKNIVNQNSLHLAIVSKSEETVCILIESNLEHQWDFDAQDDYGNSPFMLASQYGMTSVVELMLKLRNIKFDLKNKSDRNALHLAFHGKSDDTIRLLIDRFLWDFNLQDYYGNSPFMIASWVGMTAIVKLMIDSQKVTFDLKNKCKRNALHLALNGKSEDTVRLLMEHFTYEYYDNDIDNWTPIERAIKNDWTDIVDKMKKK